MSVDAYSMIGLVKYNGSIAEPNVKSLVNNSIEQLKYHPSMCHAKKVCILPAKKPTSF